MPRFTVIIPTKARPEMLARAIASVRAQRDAAFELLVADDGAGEGLAVAMGLGARGFSSGGAGQVAARNMALARVETDWIAWLDDDDWWSGPDHLARAAAALNNGAEYWFAGGDFIEDGEPPVPFAPPVDALTLERDNGILVSALCYRGSLHERLGRFDESLPIYWDWDWSLRVARSGGRDRQYREEQGVQAMKKPEFTVRAVLNRGKASATVWTCDFSYDYVKINAEYRS